MTILRRHPLIKQNGKLGDLGHERASEIAIGCCDEEVLLVCWSPRAAKAESRVRLLCCGESLVSLSLSLFVFSFPNSSIDNDDGSSAAAEACFHLNAPVPWFALFCLFLSTSYGSTERGSKKSDPAIPWNFHSSRRLTRKGTASPWLLLPGVQSITPFSHPFVHHHGLHLTRRDRGGFFFLSYLSSSSLVNFIYLFLRLPSCDFFPCPSTTRILFVFIRGPICLEIPGRRDHSFPSGGSFRFSRTGRRRS